jgi:PKD repeat protein
LAVQFNDTSTNSPTAWNWSFGDGAFSTIRNATHTYTTAAKYTVNFTATNSAGSNITSKAGYIVVALPASPTITGVLPSSGSMAGNTAVTITGTGFTKVTGVKFGLVNATNYIVYSSTSIVAVSPAAGTTGTVNVTVATSVGTSSITAADQFTYVPVAPTVTGINPTTGPLAGGTAIMINGTGFTGVTSVKFGASSAANYIVISPSSIVAVSPAAGTAGAINVTVITSAGTSAITTADRFTYSAGVTVASASTVKTNSAMTVITPATGPLAGNTAVTITGIAPATEPLAGNTAVTITGTGFTKVTGVKFGVVNATNYIVYSSTSIVAVPPAANTPGTVNVTVTTQDRTSSISPADQFVYT